MKRKADEGILLSSDFAMLKAYHIIGPSKVPDVARIADAHHQSRIIQELAEKHRAIIVSGALSPAQDQEHSRQFALDRLVGDDQYVFLSIGKRYWHTPGIANFGFVFDAEELLLHHAAILRDGDLMQDYEDLLDEIVSEYTTSRDSVHWTEEEKAALFEALDNPDKYPDYKSPNDDYYDLCSAIEHGDEVAAPYVKEATEQFIRRAHHLQSQRQYTGHEAAQMARQIGNSGHYELLIKDQLYIPLARGYVLSGEEVLKNPEGEKTIAEYVEEYGLDRYILTNAIRDKNLGKSWGLQARSAGYIRMIRQADFDAWYLKYLQNKQKRDNRLPKSR